MLLGFVIELYFQSSTTHTLYVAYLEYCFIFLLRMPLHQTSHNHVTMCDAPQESQAYWHRVCRADNSKIIVASFRLKNERGKRLCSHQKGVWELAWPVNCHTLCKFFTWGSQSCSTGCPTHPPKKKKKKNVLLFQKKILLKIIIELNYVNTAQGLVTHLHNRIYPQSKKLPPYCLPFCEKQQSHQLKHFVSLRKSGHILLRN